jgi:hypothetical protein
VKKPTLLSLENVKKLIFIMMGQQITLSYYSVDGNANKRILNADENSVSRQHPAQVERLRQVCQLTTFTE